VELSDASCTDAPGSAGFACVGSLPPMSPGRHSIALAAYRDAGGARLEGVRSAPLLVFVEAAQAIAGSIAPAAGIRTLDGVDVRLTEVAGGLVDPTDLAFAPDGRIFVAERSGRVRVIADGRLAPAPAAVPADVIATGRYGLLSIATDPDFARTPYLYAVYTSTEGYRLTRFRSVGDRLIEPRVLLDGVDPSPVGPAARVRFGPDGRLYLALDDGGDPARPGDLGSFNGKVLRLNVDGTTPADQAGGTPVFALNVRAPIGMDWGADGLLWIGEALPGGGGALDGRLQLVVAPTVGARRGTTVARYTLPAGVEPSGVAFYRGRLMPAFRDDLFLATSEGLLRLRVDAADPRTIVAAERMLREVASGARAIGIGPDGAIYVCTPDALLRLTPGAGA